MIEPAAIERSDGGGAWLINHLPTILWHRRLYVIIPAVLLFVAGLVTAYSLPTLYRSTATMLVESQDLPTDIVQAPGTGEIEQRIAKIREQVLSRGDLISLIEQNNLYESERRSNPMSYVVDKMRKATTVGALGGDIGGGSAPAKGNVIAINMSFDYPEPAKAQAVMQSYVTQFLRMDSDQIEDQANLTVRFLSEQAAKLQAQVQKIINVIFAEGQLDECDLTLRDLNLIAQSFLHTLEGIYHARPEYPAGALQTGPKGAALTVAGTKQDGGKARPAGT